MEEKPFKFTDKQIEAQKICAGPATHAMLYGGGRSAKTFRHVANIVMRCLIAPTSRHAITRFRFNHVKQTIGLDTFPKVMRLAFPNVQYRLDKQDWLFRLPGDTEVWLLGLDDKARTDKVLGFEFATIFLNETSQISWSSRETARTRLAQKVMRQVAGQEDRLLKLRMLYDQNPPTKAHWTYQLFELKRHPETRKPIPDPDNYASFQMNPESNAENLPPDFFDEMKSLSGRARKRFLDGEYVDDNPTALWNEITIDKYREQDGDLPDFVRVVVAVDPSGASDDENAENDEIGILVVALGSDGEAYVLEDLSIKAGPAKWGKVATNGFDRHAADVVVGERNFGGEMVKFTIQTARPDTPYKHVTASRGKTIRAQPVSALYENGKVHHVGRFRQLEDELLSFSTFGYLGQKSPNRADALIWAIYELFPALTKEQKQIADDDRVESAFRKSRGRGFWGK